MQVFNEPPNGIQPAPHEPRMIAAGYQISIREINFAGVHDKDTLMMAFLSGLALTDNFGRNWDALYDVLTDPETRPAKLALLLCDYAHFRRKHATLSAELESVLLDAQANAAENERQLWLLTEERDNNTKHW